MEQDTEYIKRKLADYSKRERGAKNLLAGVYGLLSQFLPVDTMHVSAYDANSAVLECKAMVVNRKVMLIQEIFRVSEDVGRIAEQVAGPTTLLFNNSSEHSAIKDITDYLKVKASISLVVQGFQAAPGCYAILSFAAYGSGRYQPEHIDLINRLEGPLTSALKVLQAHIDKDRLKKGLLSGIWEVRNSLEHQRMDLVLNSQDGLKSILHQVEQVAPLESPVLILGETGVGKELIASAIHRQSKRADAPFVAVNCGAIPESLIDSELFGFEKGAFTGASQMKTGYFEQAENGSLFLDEIGELSLQAQTKLLRVLQDHTIQRVGGMEPIPLDVRIIAATNRNLRRMIEAHRFRPDLWYRLDVFPINVPPLRDRKRDIPTLVQYLINRKLFEMNLPFEPRMAPEAMDQLIDYDWPGNIRELQNVIERELILCKGEPMTFSNLAPAPPRAADEPPPPEDGGFPTMEQMMAKHIRQSLKMSKGKVDGPGGAADLLKMNPSTLRARMKKLRIQVKRSIQ